jgi:hypothetical protein
MNQEGENEEERVPRQTALYYERRRKAATKPSARRTQLGRGGMEVRKRPTRTLGVLYSFSIQLSFPRQAQLNSSRFFRHHPSGLRERCNYTSVHARGYCLHCWILPSQSAHVVVPKSPWCLQWPLQRSTASAGHSRRRSVAILESCNAAIYGSHRSRRRKREIWFSLMSNDSRSKADLRVGDYFRRTQCRCIYSSI